MDNIHNIIAVGGYEGNQSRFVTRMNPVKIKKEAEIAVTSIFHGQVFNISDDNNKIHFYNTVEVLDMFTAMEVHALITLGDLDIKMKTVTIPSGFYHSIHAICLAIEEQISSVIKTKKYKPLAVSLDKHRQIVHLSLDNLIITNRKDSPWRLLGVQTDLYSTYDLQNTSFEGESLPAFIYINIIENSYINGKLSRISSVIPIKTNPGWNFFHQAHPYFVSINVKEFSNILIEIRDINGKFLNFNPSFKTILTLSVRPSTLYKESN